MLQGKQLLYSAGHEQEHEDLIVVGNHLTAMR